MKEVIESYSNGQLMYRKNYNNGKLQGLWEWWYSNGEQYSKNYILI